MQEIGNWLDGKSREWKIKSHLPWEMQKLQWRFRHWQNRKDIQTVDGLVDQVMLKMQGLQPDQAVVTEGDLPINYFSLYFKGPQNTAFQCTALYKRWNAGCEVNICDSPTDVAAIEKDLYSYREFKLMYGITEFNGKRVVMDYSPLEFRPFELHTRVNDQWTRRSLTLKERIRFLTEILGSDVDRERCNQEAGLVLKTARQQGWLIIDSNRNPILPPAVEE